ncbi:MAG: hypothetical protein ABIR54_10455 [Burkholderiaceae bacterium]
MKIRSSARAGGAASARPARLALRAAVPAAAFAFCAAAHAIDYGPFSLTGFGKAEIGRQSNQCNDCQRFPGENKQRVWADQLVVGTPYKTETTHLTLFQPYLGAHYDLGGGFKISGLLSQRWRNGKVDIPGTKYEENVAISHEDYGSIRVGKMTTRGWALADFPYGSNVGLADEWGASGAGYGINKEAIRYTTRTFDLAGGDLVLEATYDRGDTRFKIHKPRFWEFYGQYHHGDLVVDAVYQDSRNGNPQAWGHGPFSGLTANPADDTKVGGAGQSTAEAMARYQVTSALEVSGGLRRNRWSGADAVITQYAASGSLWNSMFNVDWNGTRNGIANPGYAATSNDAFAGLRYTMQKWTASAGMAYLGKAKTANPSERGQSNWATFNTLGLNYDVDHGLQVYASFNVVHYGRLGLSPLSMPGNAAFTGVDSRVTRNGNGFLAGAVYVF